MASSESQNLVDRLKEWALTNGKTNAQVARLLGVDRRRVYDWFTKGKTPSLEHGLRIQAFLKKYGRLKR